MGRTMPGPRTATEIGATTVRADGLVEFACSEDRGSSCSPRPASRPCLRRDQNHATRGAWGSPRLPHSRPYALLPLRPIQHRLLRSRRSTRGRVKATTRDGTDAPFQGCSTHLRRVKWLSLNYGFR